MPKKDAFERIAALPVERISELRARLKKGESPQSVAKLIQNEWKLYPDVKFDTLTKQLFRYRRDVVVKSAIEQLLETKGRDGIPAVLKKTDVMGEVEKLITIQQRRLDVVLTQEIGKPLLLSMVSSEMDRLMAYLDRMARLQMETGVLARAPRTVEGMFGIQPGARETDPTLVTFRWTEETEKAFKVIDGDFEALA